MKFTLLFLALISISICSLGQALAANSFHAEYEITRGSLTVGTLKRTLMINDTKNYHFISTITSQGLVGLFLKLDSTEISRGKIIDGKVRPETFSYSRKDKKEKNYNIDFDHDAKNVSNSGGKYAWKKKVSDQILDRLSYQLQLILDLESAPKAIRYTIARRKGLKEYFIETMHTEDIYSGVGLVSATKVRRFSKSSKTETSVWCARELGWVPVKVEHKDKKGNITTALLSKFDSKINAMHASPEKGKSP